jgi:poly(hydroxyalkanoate) depolymerase family esterase
MKNSFGGRAPSFDAEAIHRTIQQALASAGLADSMPDVGETIRRALAAGGLADVGPRGGDSTAVDVAAGRFETHAFSGAAGSRAYKLYVPARKSAAPRPLLVMLHGCTQSADDFAAGTQMNRLADEQDLLVVYPEQSSHANGSKCWNWFQPRDQRRGSGEPALIAGIVREVVQAQGADPQRIFVAGLSAGAAMAVVLGETYPDLFAGVGAHSGLAYGSAHDIPSALAAMKGGRTGAQGQSGAVAGRPPMQAEQAVPVIVFHGDRDHTVRPVNGAAIVQQAQQAHRGGTSLRVSTQTGVASGGRRYSRSVHSDAQGHVRIESWTLHGAGHAWSGGHASGSYTDGAGPDASAEMLRFFLALPRAGSA